MRTHLQRCSYVAVMDIIIIEMILCCTLPVERVPFGEPGEVSRQHGPPPPEQPNHHPQDGESRGPLAPPGDWPPALPATKKKIFFTH